MACMLHLIDKYINRNLHKHIKILNDNFVDRGIATKITIIVTYV